MKTVSLELSKELKENGYPQDSYMFWVYRPARKKKGLSKATKESYLLENLRPEWQKEYIKDNIFKRDKDWQKWLKGFIFYASPTADEILNRLPHKIPATRGEYSNWYFETYKDDKGWEISYDGTSSQSDKFLADAAAKMWLYLKKNNLLSKTGGKE